jgi:20S proteasome alpha/beta subunit
MIGGSQRCKEGSFELYWIDDTGAIQKVSYSAHGKETPLALSVMDQLNRKQSMSAIDLQTGCEVVRSCWKAVGARTLNKVNNIAIHYATLTGTTKSEMSL